MLEEKNNLKDTHSQAGLNLRDTEVTLSYNKSNKLITALFMVTDIMDKEEPLRNKLRTLGVAIISDINADPTKVTSKVREVLSLLDISLAINLTSEMNRNILKQEFLKLLESVKEYKQIRSSWLQGFIHSPNEDEEEKYFERDFNKTNYPSRTKDSSTRIGVQKGSTLMSALRGVNTKMSDRISGVFQSVSKGFDVLKKHRRQDIITVLRTSNTALTITDIKNKSKGLNQNLSDLTSCGEKTLQRELVSMVKDGVLKKEGEKRWSRYSILQ